ncbi:hypothetical protein VZ94_00795 [Methylocucumis oryzae]|uniref:Uncharacterized protein n=1 Tax=Methylocucumis oryzae TaxID=1632867 RepID=A0A0F3IMM4_9GAMM|nr:hypothetical protein VZ94_00795 [Methylocucumis oryzae]
MNYLIEFEKSVQKCWVDLSIDGDPGRTTIKENATVFETLNLANECAKNLETKYRRKLNVVSAD